jgi:RNA polymerase sigma-70 factor, ECF subfamily
MESKPTDSDLLTRSLAEPRAFEVLFDRHFDAIHRYLHRRAGREIADELAAETFAVAYERRASCRSADSALPWLYGIATNLLRRKRRIERRQLNAFARRGLCHCLRRG